MKWLLLSLIALAIVVGYSGPTEANTVKKEVVKTEYSVVNEFMIPDFSVQNSNDFVIVELVDDNGFHFKGRVQKTHAKMESVNGFNIYVTTNLGNTCTFPDCGYQGGVRYCCEGMGNCWKC